MNTCRLGILECSTVLPILAMFPMTGATAFVIDIEVTKGRVQLGNLPFLNDSFAHNTSILCSSSLDTAIS